MPNVGGFLSALGAGFSGLGVDQQLAQKQAQALMEQQRQQKLDALSAEMHAVNMRHVNAETKHLEEPDDFAGHVFDQAGNPYIVHKNGELTPATIRGAQTPSAPPPSAPPSPAPAAPVHAPPTNQPLPGAPQAPIMPPPTPTQHPIAQAITPPPMAPPAQSGVGKFGTPAKAQSEIPGTPEWEAAEKFKAGLNKPDNTLVTAEVDDGKGGTKLIYVPRSQAAGMAAPPRAGGGGALAARQRDYVGLIAHAIPKMEPLLNDIEPYGVTALIKYPMAANPMANAATQQYTMYAREALAGILHEESGARLSDKQIEWGVPRYIIIGGDDEETKIAKMQALRDLLVQRAKNANYLPEGAPLSDEAKVSFGLSNAGGGRAAGPGGGGGTPAPRLKVSDGEFAAAWRAGKRTDDEIGTWVASQKRP